MRLRDRIEDAWLDAGIHAHAYWTREMDYTRDFEEYDLKPRDVRSILDIPRETVQGLAFFRDAPIKMVRGAGLGVIGGLGSIAAGEPHPHYLIEGALFGANTDFLIYVGRGIYHDFFSRDQP